LWIPTRLEVSKAGNSKFDAAAYTGTDSYSVVKDSLSADVTKDSTSVKFAAAANNTTTPSAVKTSKLYFTSATTFLSIEDTGDDLSVSTATGLMKVSAATSGLTVYAIFKDGETEASYILYVAKELNTAAAASDILYLQAAGKVVSTADDTYTGKVYFMDKVSADATSITMKDSYDQGFYKYSVDTKNVYTLSSTTPLGAYTTSADGFMAITADSAYYNSTSSKYMLSASGVADLDDVDYTNAVIYDSRDADDDMPYDVYSGEITSASQLKSAIGKGTVDMDVYFDNGDITFICVTAVEDAVKYSVAAPTIVAGSTSNTANYSVATSYTAPVGAGTVITITLTGASGAVAQNVAVAATGTGVTVSPASFSTVAGAGTYTVEVTVGSANVTAITLTMTTPA
jgi:hypothetical protein